MQKLYALLLCKASTRRRLNRLGYTIALAQHNREFLCTQAHERKNVVCLSLPPLVFGIERPSLITTLMPAILPTLYYLYPPGTDEGTIARMD